MNDIPRADCERITSQVKSAADREKAYRQQVGHAPKIEDQHKGLVSNRGCVLPIDDRFPDAAFAEAFSH
jgi:phosphohistidine phosphatase SixA